MFNSHLLVFFLFHCPRQHKNWHEWHLESITRERLIMCIDMRLDCSFLFTVIIKVSNLEFGNISIQNRNWNEMKAKCARALIRYLKAKESERENSNELSKTKLNYATCRQRVCGQNKDYLCLHAARALRAKRTLIWRSCAFNRWPMTMPVLDGVKPVTLPYCGTSEPD